MSEQAFKNIAAREHDKATDANAIEKMAKSSNLRRSFTINIPMKSIAILVLLFTLASCAEMITKQRMKAAQRKLLDAESLQQQDRWDEAHVMVEKLRKGVQNSIADKPERRTMNGSPLNLLPMLQAWENAAWQPLADALGKRDAVRSAQSFAAMRQQCSTCHLALGRTDIVIPHALPSTHP